jgi:hypothetical protein
VEATEKEKECRSKQEKAERQDCGRQKPGKSIRLDTVGAVTGRLLESCHALRAKGPNIRGLKVVTLATV